ncbi:MAG: antibiotic biosynthesis monooxygenase [Bacteroidota bacterium]|nr:antibiotic biosynthesis monooxygenase [Bacteroidota bacterium]
MLVRIVRMTFKPEHVEDFLNLFHETKWLIRDFNGCHHLELLKDYHQGHVYFTYSHWIDDEALQKYRNSSLFKAVWKKTKILFAEKPLAYSMFKTDIIGLKE